MTTKLRLRTPSTWSGWGATAGEPMAVTRVSAGSGPDPMRLLLLHGLGCDAACWRDFATRADPEYDLWAADLPWRGTGLPGWTARPPEDWISEAAAAVPGGPDVIVAHSFATSVLLAWLDQQAGGRADGSGPAAPELAGVILVAPLYRAAAADFDWGTVSYYLHHLDRILADGVRARSGRLLPAKRQLAIAEKVRDLIGPYGWLQFFDSYLRTPQLRTERMRMPFLLVTGGEDLAAFPSDARALGHALPDAAVHILPGLGHFPMLGPGGEFAALANHFLHTIEAARAARPGLDQEHHR